MITAKFYKSKDTRIGFNVSGHSLFDNHGRDIVCASVTSAVQLVVNAITECLKDSNCKVHILDNSVIFMLDSSVEFNPVSLKFLESLFLHINILSKSYSDHIKLIEEEVR